MRQKPKNFLFLLIFCAFSHCFAADISQVRTYPENLSCEFERTINITDGKLLVDNSWEHDGLKYGLGFYAKFNYTFNNKKKVPVPEHVRGCICLLKPCIMACCPDRRMVKNNATNNCASEQFETLLWDVGLENEEPVKTDVAKAFHWSFNRLGDCAKSYLDPQNFEFDQWYLGANGSIYLPDEDNFLTYNEHCVAVDQQTQKVLVLRCYDPQPPDARYSMLGIGMLLSVPFLIVTFIVYAVIPELRNVHGMSLMSYVGSLTVGYTVLGTVQILGSRKECHDGTSQCFNPYFCTIAAYIIYFSFIVSFFWLNTMCFDIYWTFRGVRGSTSAKKNFIYYCIYAWGLAMFCTLFSLSMDISGIPEKYKPGMYFTQTCFLQHEHISEFIYLYSILLILICMNITFFGVTAYRIKKVQSETAAVVDAESSRRHSRHQYDNYRFMLYLRLFVIMGVTWSWEVISWYVSPESPWFYVTDLINCSQGILIFLLVVCNDKVRKLVIKRYSNIVRISTMISSSSRDSRTTEQTHI
ncbi:G-protein coupled receptor Mth2-like isoform X2 [Culicoides brevitarsis]|uniref:G-protein coupled receptor Mth2-like isoform X2 n=1 Tax=Culicoides brevitarsis TaxID=469753 RepID=UPI00307C4590